MVQDVGPSGIVGLVLECLLRLHFFVRELSANGGDGRCDLGLNIAYTCYATEVHYADKHACGTALS